MNEVSRNVHIPSLDGFRAISIIIVFLGHSFPSLPIPGGLGVTIFFFISGFLITNLMLREFRDYGSIDFKGFYIRRVLRLMPPLLVTMTLGLVMVALDLAEGTLDPMALISQIFFFYNYWDVHHENDGVSGLGILWSLSVEEHFYLVIPAVFIAFWKKQWSVFWLFFAAFLILTWRIVKFSFFGFSEWEIYALTDTRIDSILWGCILAILMSTPNHWPRLNHAAFHGFALFLGVLTIFVTLIVRDDLFRSTVRYTLQGLALIPIFFYSVKYKDSMYFKIMNNAHLARLGVYSYSFYLVHYIIINSLKYNNIVQGELQVALISFMISLTYSLLINVYIEIPIKRFGQRHRKLLARSYVSASGNSSSRRHDEF